MTTASVAVVCLGTLLAAGGGEPEDDGHVAVGAVGATADRTPQRTVAPTGDVELVPLDGDADTSGGDSGKGGSGAEGPSSGDAGAGSGSGSDSGGTEEGAAEEAPGTPSQSGSASPGEGDHSGPEEGGSAEPSAPGSEDAPSGPAVLKVGEPVREALEDRWCEKVSVKFRNTGGTPVRSGRVTFGTHVIDGLGIDWATIESKRKLPASIAPGRTVTESWDLCVDAWRVPLGMHIETRDVSVKWK